jgi:sugar-specific transcriptional regulator TrmB
MFEKYLQDIGLSEKEASVYLALLAVENYSVLDLSKKTSINRSTVYIVLESLAKKGLISETTVGKKVHFQAESPERLETYVEQRKILLEEQAKKLRDIIPQIKSVQREVGEKPIVKYFEGREGILSSLEELFEESDTGGETYLLYSKDLLDSLFSNEERKKYRSTRLARKIKSKVLYVSKENDILSDEMAVRLKIDGNKYPITCDINIYKDRVRINTLGKKLAGIFIKSQDVADTLKSLFNLAFDNIKK